MSTMPNTTTALEAEASLRKAAAMVEAEPAPKPVPASLRFLEDSLDLLEHNLGAVNAHVMRLGHNLGPVLTDGRWTDPDDVNTLPAAPDPRDADAVPTHVDDRSELARHLSHLANYADRLARLTLIVGDRVTAIDTALEV